MNIKEVEEKTGISRSQIRFYEKEELIKPGRNEKNGYRDYSENDIENLKKVIFLRRLDVPVEDIRSIQKKESSLGSVLKRQYKMLGTKASEYEKLRTICKEMLDQHENDYQSLSVDHYEYGDAPVDQDKVSVFYEKTDRLFWIFMFGFGVLLAVIAYPGLPEKIPVQWNSGGVSSYASRAFIFAFPAVCLLFRFLRPFIWQKVYQWFAPAYRTTDRITTLAVAGGSLAAVLVELFIIL